ncbi:MAG: hypothetical protein CSA66_04135 [Proteobacteria bacterium]|nr:MAG: hypothetical protein CSA66_04135 [Pseudomonadota bacterium]
MFAPLLAVAAASLAIATLFYVTRLVRFQTAAPVAGNVMMGVALAALAAACVAGLTAVPLPLTNGGLAVLVVSFALACLALFAQVVWKLTVAAPVAAPLVTMVILALLIRTVLVEPAPPSSGDRALTIVHVSSTVLGVLLFSPAFVLSGLFLQQSYMLKTKQLNRVRVPSLLTLERAAWSLLFIGFPFYSVGIVLGAIWQDQIHLGVRPRQLIAGLSWAIYAFVIYRRLATGWRGSRAAVAVVAGFSVTVCAVLLYTLR